MRFFLYFFALFFGTGFSLSFAEFKSHEPPFQSTEQIIQKNNSQAFWQNTKIDLALSEIDNWKKIQNHPYLLYSFLEELKKGPVILDNFYRFFSNKEKSADKTSPEKHFKIMEQIDRMYKLFKQGSREEIQKFIKDQGFSKVEKILAVLDIVYHGSLEAEIFDLMRAIQISVNDKLSFNELSPEFVPEELRNSKETAIILSHHLLASKKPKIITKLIEQDIDFNLKPITKDNLIHSYIMLNQNLSDPKEEKLLKKGLHTFFKLPQAQALLVNKNALGIMPISFASAQPNKSIRKFFEKEAEKLQLSPQQTNMPNYTDLWIYLLNSNFEQKPFPQVSFLNFKAFLENFINFFDPFQPTKDHRQTLVSFLSDFQKQMASVEQYRLSFIQNFVSNKKGEFKNISLFLTAIIERDESVFKKLNIQTKESAEILFNNFIYRNQGHTYLLSNLLSEAIRHSFTPAVGYLLKLLQKFPSIQKQLQNNKNLPSFTLDPLSLAFITYGSLNHKNPLKPEGRKIIQLLYKNLTDFETYQFPLFFNPLEWALFFGLLEDVRFLHESKKIKFSPQTSLGIDSMTWTTDWMFYSEKQGFKNLYKYLNSLIKKAEPEDNLEATLNRIENKATKKVGEILSKTSPEEWLEQALDPQLLKKYKKGQLTNKDLEKLSQKDLEKSENKNQSTSAMDLLALKVIREFKDSIKDKKQPCKKIFH